MKNVFLAFLIVVASTCLADEKNQVVDIYSLKSLPKLPILTEGCEGECCGLIKSEKALSQIVLSDAPNRQSKQIGVVKKGEVLESADFFIKILKFGSTKVNGKKMKVFTYISEGNVSVWDGKKVRATECISGGDKCDGNLKQAQTESWLRIKLKNGVTGWAEISARGGSELEFGTCN